jgi:hypothetical protein
VLGKGKASIFRSGKVKLDKFVDANGRPLSLAQLRALERSMGGTGGAGGVPLAQVVQAAVVTPKATPIEKVLKELFEETRVDDKIKKDMYNALLPNLSTLTAQVAAKAPKLKAFNLGKKGGFYNRNDSLINIKQGTLDKSKAVMTHEYGHFIDDMIGRAARERSIAGYKKGILSRNKTVFMDKHKLDDSISNLDTRYYVSMMDKRFIEAFKSDRKALWKNKSEKTAFGKAWQKETWKEVASQRAGYRTFKKRDEYTGYGWGAIDDILDAMSLGQFHSRTHSGHGVRYFRIKGMKEKEVFAQLWALHKNNTPAARKARKMFPNLFKAFEDILEDYLKYY